ncbi:MAG: porin, partial [Burkholderiales bacterium]|nr:porin [Burkholderiales bacterium]
SSMTLSPTMRHLNYIGQTTLNPDMSTPKQGSIGGAGVGFDTGWVNSITYETPVVQGFSGVLQYGAKESSAAGDKNSYAVSGSYNNGPISATLTYVNAGKTSAPSATAYTANEKVTDLGASYDFGVVKAFGQYTHIKDSTNNNANKDTIYQLGVSVPVSDKVNVMASFGSLKHKLNVASTSTTDRVFTVGADYALSKRTGVYGAFMNNTQTNLSSGQTALFGIKHTF